MDDLKKKRSQIKGKITRFSTFLESFEQNGNIHELEARLEKLEVAWEPFDDIQSEIEDNDEAEITNRETLENLYFKVIGKAKAYLHSGKVLSSNSRQTPPVSSSSEINPLNNSVAQLPKISLPIFDGNYEEFKSFKDIFQSLIDSRSDLPQIQRFHYLRSSLRGEALTHVSSLEISDQNYNVAWELLSSRYDNKRLVVTKHIKAIFDVEKCERGSPSKLRGLIDTTTKHLKSLNSLGLPVESWDAILVYTITQKLDNDILKDWEASCNKGEIPTMKQLIDFLEKKAETLESFQVERPKQPLANFRERKVVNHINNESKQQSLCEICHNPHRIYSCKTFLNFSVPQRRDSVRKANLCFNCLRNNHKFKECSAGPCKICQERHNSLLHLDNSNRQNQPAVSTHVNKHQKVSTPVVLLATAVVVVTDKNGNKLSCRALLDNGSQSNFITESFAKRLGHQFIKMHQDITAIGGSSLGRFKGIRCKVDSRFDGCCKELECLIIPQITNPLPATNINTKTWPIPRNLFLADPNFNKCGTIDMLIGAEEYFQLCGDKRIELGYGLPILIQTRLGWIVGGRATSSCEDNRVSLLCNCSINLDQSIKRFWEIENANEERKLTIEERAAENVFTKSQRRSVEGRFTVELPKRDNFTQLGDSKDIATRRFLNMEKRLNKLTDLKKTYQEFMSEYECLGHMKLEPEPPVSNCYYLPHHYVINEASQTTKLRVVFDASCKTTSGLSLNDVLMVGPMVQQELISIIMRFREHRYVVTADISKMYRQINIDYADTNYQLILWRNSVAEPIKTYRLLTVTYGTGPASFLATRALKQLGVENEHDFPKGAEVVKRDFNVDDMLTGANTAKELSDIIKQVVQILKKGCFPLHKWCTNVPDVLSKTLDQQQESTYIPKLENDYTVKTLGLWWNPLEDVFKFSIRIEDGISTTKREILSEISKIFDPLGLVGPVIAQAKIFIQKLWELRIGWDETLPKDMICQWAKFRTQLNHLEKLEISRWLLTGQDSTTQLHGFCDASESAYGAAIFLRTSFNGSIETRLLCSKSRVAPLKKVTLPRLELCEALLLSRLLQQVKAAMLNSFEKYVLWCDSSVALAWIMSPSGKWKTFVANRVAEIQDLTTGCEWRHVGSSDNPADVLSRGLQPSELIGMEIWWKGPYWLSKPEMDWPSTEHNTPSSIPEQKACLLIANPATVIVFSKFSSFIKIIRSIAYVQRFIQNCKIKRIHGKLYLDGDISNWEFEQATLLAMKLSQKETFSEELKNLKDGKAIPRNSRLLPLNPIFHEGLIRVGGRIENSELNYEQKHQIILDDKHHLTRLLIEFEHRKNMHAGPQLLLATIRQRYWPLGGRNLIRKVLHSCVKCFKCNPKSEVQLMGDLPRERLQVSRAFVNVGVDYCGPINIRTSTKRGSRTEKAYVAVFICLAVKAVHIELVSDMTADCFLGALKRFIGRRGKPYKIFSDNGTNFVGAQKKLHEKYLSVVNDPSISVFSSIENMEWSFIPPRAPNFGGLWEAAIKSFKYHFKRVVGEAFLSYEEMNTFIIMIESCLNSRPLTSISSSPLDPNLLTPGHFLVGSALNTIPEPDITAIPINRLRRWERLQQMLQHFWRRWSREYLCSLQPRGRWKKKISNLNPGQVVIVHEENQPPLTWCLGRIEEVYPGKDGLVRVAPVRTSSGTYRRPISKLFVLPIYEDKCEITN